jgi:hypothetical protein
VSPSLRGAHLVSTLPHGFPTLPPAPQKQLAAQEEERQKQKLYEKRVKYSKMSAAKKERFRQIRVWKKTEVARLIQQWWLYILKQRGYYEAVKLAQAEWRYRAAAHIQAVFRGYCVRRDLKWKRYYCVKIQRLFRKWSKRRALMLRVFTLAQRKRYRNVIQIQSLSTQLCVAACRGAVRCQLLWLDVGGCVSCGCVLRHQPEAGWCGSGSGCTCSCDGRQKSVACEQKRATFSTCAVKPARRSPITSRPLVARNRCVRACRCAVVRGCRLICTSALASVGCGIQHVARANASSEARTRRPDQRRPH